MNYPVAHSVKFHGTPLQVYEKDGEYFVPMKPLCQAMGLDWKAQHKLIQRDQILSQVVVMMTTTSVGRDGKTYNTEMLSLPIQYLNGWLFKLDIRRYAPDMQEKLIRYQKECYQVLFNHFFKQPFTGKAQQPALPSPEVVRNAIGIANEFGFTGNQGLLSANRMLRANLGHGLSRHDGAEGSGL